jgi:DNA-binding CsgD family transcriptional regulator
MSAPLRPVVRRRRDELVRQASAARSVTDIFAVASKRLHTLIPHDASAWVTTDPGTGFPTSPSRIEGFSASADLCTEHWRQEFIDEDVNRFRDLMHRERSAAALHAAAIDPRRSPRFRRFLQPFGFSDELRGVLRVGDAPWATVTLWRREGRAAFSRAETDLVASLSAPLGEALRRQVRTGSATVNSPLERPGVFVFNERGRLVSANEYATAWLDELPPNDRVPTATGMHLPVWMVITAVRAYDSLVAGGDGTARTRVRSRRGRWLVGYASCTHDESGAPASTALVIEPASPALIAPILVEAYGLTEREQEVTREIARGAATDEIARALYLSPHTVRDHIKAILTKVGVSSRGELVATLYAEHYEPVHLAAGAREAVA